LIPHAVMTFPVCDKRYLHISNPFKMAEPDELLYMLLDKSVKPTNSVVALESLRLRQPLHYGLNPNGLAMPAIVKYFLRFGVA
jgi:hypothetical protein